jgi:hypothetical protein
MTPRWIDLYCGEDPHPRRFDRMDTVLEYLRRIERLSEDAVNAVAREGEVSPPAARRAYRVERLQR